MWDKVSYLTKQHDGRDWSSNHRPSDLKSNALTTLWTMNCFCLTFFAHISLGLSCNFHPLLGRWSYVKSGKGKEAKHFHSLLEEWINPLYISLRSITKIMSEEDSEMRPRECLHKDNIQTNIRLYLLDPGPSMVQFAFTSHPPPFSQTLISAQPAPLVKLWNPGRQLQLL